MVVSTQVDNQRRLAVVFNAPDGMTFGGFLVIDNRPNNATPAYSDPTYGPLMDCNNKSTCMGFWPIPENVSAGPYSFTTEVLNAQKFPDGTYYLQVDTKNEDPHASTRQEEFSEITTFILKTSASTVPHKVSLLAAMKLPVSNGTPLCIAWRDNVLLGNRVIDALNNYNQRMNTALAKFKTITPSMGAIYQRALKQTSDIRVALAKGLERANSACSATPSVVSENGEFVPVPIPASNGKDSCNKSRAHIVYVNQELTKIVNNLRTTSRSQTTRVKQLESRFNQLSADLKKSWPILFQACNPI